MFTRPLNCNNVSYILVVRRHDVVWTWLTFITMSIEWFWRQWSHPTEFRKRVSKCVCVIDSMLWRFCRKVWCERTMSTETRKIYMACYESACSKFPIFLNTDLHNFDWCTKVMLDLTCTDLRTNILQPITLVHLPVYFDVALFKHQLPELSDQILRMPSIMLLQLPFKCAWSRCLFSLNFSFFLFLSPNTGKTTIVIGYAHLFCHRLLKRLGSDWDNTA